MEFEVEIVELNVINPCGMWQKIQNKVAGGEGWGGGWELTSATLNDHGPG